MNPKELPLMVTRATAFLLTLLALISVAAAQQPAHALPSAISPTSKDFPRQEVPAAAAVQGQGKPIDVRVTTWLLDISEIDLETSTFQLDATVELRWQNPSFAVGDVPPFEIMNAMDVRMDPYPTAPVGPWLVKNWRIHAKMRANYDLHHYPFDVQKLELRIEHPLMQLDQLKYHCETRYFPEAGVTLEKRLGPDFHLPDWELRKVSSAETVVSYGPKEHFSRYTVTVEVQRELLRALIAEFAPLMLMVLLSLAASLIPPDKLDGKLLLTVLSILVAVELQVAFQESVPQLGYLTAIDWAYLCAYVSISTGVLQTILEYRQHAGGHDDWAALTRWRGTLISAGVFFVPVLGMLLWHGIHS